MNATPAVVLYYAQPNRQSINALAGALETDPFFDAAAILFPRDEAALFKAVREASATKAVVGISFMTVQLGETRRLVARLRAESAENVAFIAGGPHPTADPVGTLELGFDAVVRGEGEATLPHLLKALASDEDLSTVQGIAFCSEDGSVRLTEPRPWIDINAYPPLSARYHKIGAVEITRGCPHACAFCQTSHLFGGKPRHRSVEQLAKYVDLMQRTDLPDVRLLSPSAFSYGSRDGRELNLPAVKELLASLHRVLRSDGRLFFGSFPSEARPEHIVPETIALLKQYTHNDNVVVGAQSGSARVLRLCRRGHTVEQSVAAVELTLAAGLKANVDFILGLPGETDDDMEQTAALMEKLAVLGARIHAHSFLPLPQTGFANEQPTQPSPKLQRVVNRLMGRGQLYGEWQAQRIVAGASRPCRVVAVLSPLKRGTARKAGRG